MATKPVLINGMPPDILYPPCNDPGCRRCDATRAEMREYAEEKMRLKLSALSRRRLLR